MKRTTIYIDDELKAQMEEYADRVNSTLSKQIRLAMEAWLAKKNRRRRKAAT